MIGRSLDVGTTKIVAARWDDERRQGYRRTRNAFIDLKQGELTRRMLRRLHIPFTEPNGRIVVLGSDAFELANVLERNTRRPMRDGVVSPAENEALYVIRSIAGRLMGRPRVAGEPCFFSVPADPIDRDMDVLYQTGAIDRIVRDMGYTPHPVREGLAVVFSELGGDGYTGVGISCGGGMFNVCLAYKGVEALSFSTVRGGDWIDTHTAQALGLTPAEVCAEKEAGFDLRRPRGRVQEAIAMYTRHLVRYTLECLARKFEDRDVLPAFGRPVPIVLAGGTTQARGFLHVFHEEYRRVRMPLAFSKLRLAKMPVTAVARGGLMLGSEIARSERAA